MSKLYHYTNLNTAIEFILPSMKLRTNSLKKMNDPKENQPWAFSTINIDYLSIFPETYSEQSHIEHQFMFGNKIRENIQVICFVNNDDNKGAFNEMMWAHYASNHKGVCLEIDEDLFFEENQELLKGYKLENVQYGKHQQIAINYDRKMSPEYNIFKIIENQYRMLFLRKSFYWEHENEKRLLVYGKEHFYLGIKKSLTGIFLGLFFPYMYRPSIDALLSQLDVTIFDLVWNKNESQAIVREQGDYRLNIMRKFL